MSSLSTSANSPCSVLIDQKLRSVSLSGCNYIRSQRIEGITQSNGVSHERLLELVPQSFAKVAINKLVTSEYRPNPFDLDATLEVNGWNGGLRATSNKIPFWELKNTATNKVERGVIEIQNNESLFMF